MSVNTFGRLLRVTTWGESHGPAMGAAVDGCPPGVELREENIQPWLDWRRPGSSRHAIQRREPDVVRILSGTFNGRTTGTPIALLIDNVDSRSKDYEEIAGGVSAGPRRLRLLGQIQSPSRSSLSTISTRSPSTWSTRWNARARPFR